MSTKVNALPYKIYECCLCMNELELLDVKLHEHDCFVDMFVIIEFADTFRGQSKPFYYDENQELFKKFSHKIKHVKVTNKLSTYSYWNREALQRNCILSSLKECKEQDIIILSDVDEILNSSKMHILLEDLQYKQWDVVYGEMKIYRHFLNRYDAVNSPDICPAITTYGFLKNHNPYYVRFDLRKSRPHYENLGWHFNGMGGYIRTLYKTLTNTHDLVGNFSPERFRMEVSGNKLVEIDETYPKYILENLDFFKKTGFIDFCRIKN